MKRRASWSVLAIVLFWSLTISVVSTESSAQTPRGAQTVPAVPRAGTIFMVRINAYNCDGFWSEDRWDREVVVDGSSITVTVPYTMPFSGGGCDFGNPFHISWYLGPFEAGQYSLTIFGVDPLSGDAGTLDITIPLTIAENIAPRIVPMQPRRSLVLAGVLIGILGLFAARRVA